MKLSSLTGIYKNSMHSKILGTGSYLPSSVRTNADLEQMVETSDEWIVERTGIRERRIAGADETVATLSYQAALRATEAAGLTAADLDMIVLATTSAENAFPAAACELQGLLGVPSIPAFDVAAACAGFTYALYCRSPSNRAPPAMCWSSGPMYSPACAIHKIAAPSSCLVTGQGL